MSKNFFYCAQDIHISRIILIIFSQNKLLLNVDIFVNVIYVSEIFAVLTQIRQVMTFPKRGGRGLRAAPRAAAGITVRTGQVQDDLATCDCPRHPRAFKALRENNLAGGLCDTGAEGEVKVDQRCASAPMPKLMSFVLSHQPVFLNLSSRHI